MSDRYIVRLATPDDAAVLSSLAARTFVDLVGHLYSDDDLQVYLAGAYPIEQMRAEIEDPKRTTVFVFDKDDLINPCGYTMLNDGSVRPGDEGQPSEHYLEVKRVYIDRPHHGTGAAYVMMAHVMKIVNDKNRKITWLGVGKQNDRAQRFYQKHGFTETGSRWFRIGYSLHPDFVFSIERDAPRVAASS